MSRRQDKLYERVVCEQGLGFNIIEMRAETRTDKDNMYLQPDGQHFNIPPHYTTDQEQLHFPEQIFVVAAPRVHTHTTF